VNLSRILLAFFLLGAASCIPNKELVYFSDPEFNSQHAKDIINEQQQYRLQSRDVLSIRVKSLDAESVEYFNIQPETGWQNFNNISLYLNGYSINKDGYITLPEVGNIVVAGLTVLEAQDRVREVMSRYLNNATILVKLVSFKITVLGEVNDPGYYYVYNDQATILEGLGLAGDLTDFGNRENITLIRQTQSGSKAILLNLQDPKLLSSEYYYLQPNDAIYVQPLKAKNTRSNLNTFTVLSVLFGAISSTVLLLRFVNDN